MTYTPRPTDQDIAITYLALDQLLDSHRITEQQRDAIGRVLTALAQHMRTLDHIRQDLHL